MVFGFDLVVVKHQVESLVQNLWVWFIRSMLRVPPPSLLPPDYDASESGVGRDDKCSFVEIVGPGGVDQLRLRANACWAVCGYNLMKEFEGSQRICSPVRADNLPADTVVVRNKVFSINYADVCVRFGLYESALRYVGWPICPGFDIAGVVEAASPGSGFQAGDRVWGCSLFGAYAGRVVVPKRQLLKAPGHISFEALAALPGVSLTALHAAQLAGLWPGTPMGPNRDVLVHSAAGGVGDMLCQILKLCGCRVCGVVGSASKISSCKADVVVDKSAKEKWVAVAQRCAPGGFRAVFDANGVATLRDSYNLLSRNGRLVVYGFHSNLPKTGVGLGTLSPFTWIKMGVGLLQTPAFDPMDITLASKAVMGFNLSFFAEEHELCERYFGQLQEWVCDGKIAAPPVKTMTLAEVRDAHMLLTSGTTVGKLVITI